MYSWKINTSNAPSLHYLLNGKVFESKEAAAKALNEELDKIAKDDYRKNTLSDIRNLRFENVQTQERLQVLPFLTYENKQKAVASIDARDIVKLRRGQVL